MSVANTITYKQEFEDILQDRLDHPTIWKEVCNVDVTRVRVINSSYMSTTPSVQTVTRGTGHEMQTFAETNEQLTISTERDLGLFVDWSDLGQSPWTKPAELFDRIGALLNEFVEANFLAQHASWTDFDNASIGGSSGNITVSASNIDDIIRGVKREIRENNGQGQMNQFGVGFVWRAADFELLEAYTQARIKSRGLYKSLLINGENLRLKAMATLNKQIRNLIVQLQRLSVETPFMGEATVRTV